MLSIISKGTETKITTAISNFLSKIWEEILEVYESLVELVEPFMGETAGGIFVIAIAAGLIMLIAVKALGK